MHRRYPAQFSVVSSSRFGARTERSHSNCPNIVQSIVLGENRETVRWYFQTDRHYHVSQSTDDWTISPRRRESLRTADEFTDIYIALIIFNRSCESVVRIFLTLREKTNKSWSGKEVPQVSTRLNWSSASFTWSMAIVCSMMITCPRCSCVQWWIYGRKSFVLSFSLALFSWMCTRFSMTNRSDFICC